MKKNLVIALCVCALLSGCAKKAPSPQERLSEMNERRIDSVEKNITELNEQIARLNNRVYEVRGARGRKTGMTVVPVNPGQETQPQVVATVPVQTHNQPNHHQYNQKNKKHDAHAAKKEVKGYTAQKTAPVAQPKESQTTQSLPALPPTDTNPQLVHAPKTNAPGLPPTLPLESQAPALPQEQVYSAPKQPITPQPVASRANAGEEASYKQALSLARKGRSQESIQKFNDYLAKYPNGKYAPNAEFWIGECYYSQGKYKEALGKYSQVNAKYPNHHKSADALLKAGMTYKRLGDSSNAQEKYSQLLQTFPKSEAASRARKGQ